MGVLSTRYDIENDDMPIIINYDQLRYNKL
jgi:hypothetical protein